MNTNKFSTKHQTSCGAKHSKTNFGVEIKKTVAILLEVEMMEQPKRKLKQ